MDYQSLSNDEFLDAGRAWIVDLHRRIDALPESYLKNRLDRLANSGHEILEIIWDRAAGGGIVRPYEGTNKPNPPPPPGGP